MYHFLRLTAEATLEIIQRTIEVITFLYLSITLQTIILYLPSTPQLSGFTDWFSTATYTTYYWISWWKGGAFISEWLALKCIAIISLAFLGAKTTGYSITGIMRTIPSGIKKLYRIETEKPPQSIPSLLIEQDNFPGIEEIESLLENPKTHPELKESIMNALITIEKEQTKHSKAA